MLAVAFGVAAGAVVAAAGRAGPDPPALLAHHRAGAGHRRACRWPGWRCCRRSGAPTPARSRGRPWTQRVTRIAGAVVPNAGLLLIGAAVRRAAGAAGVPALHPARPGHPGRGGGPGDGDRARHRRAQGVHAGLRHRRRGGRAGRGRWPGSTFGTVSPGQGTSLLIFAFIVVVIGGMGSVTGSAVAAVAVGLLQQFVNYYAARASATSAWSRCSPRCCSCARHGTGQRRRKGDRMTGAAALAPLAVLVLLAVLPYSTVDIPGVFDGPLNSPGTLQLLAICLVFGGLAARLRPAVRPDRPAVVRARALLRGRRLRHRRSWSTGPAGRCGWPALVAIAGAVGARAGARGGRPADQRDRVRHGDARLRPGRRDPGGPRTRAGSPAARRGCRWTAPTCPSALVGVVNTVNLYWLALAFAARGRGRAAPARRRPGRPGARRHPRRRPAGRACSGLDPYRFKLLAFVASAATAAAGGVVYALLVGGASPHVAASDLTLSLLVMVVLGGPGTRWGPVLGGVAVHVPRPPADRGRLVRRGGRPARRAVRTAVPAAVHPRHGLHPGRLLLPRRAGRPAGPTGSAGSAPAAPAPARPGNDRPVASRPGRSQPAHNSPDPSPHLHDHPSCGGLGVSALGEGPGSPELG